MNAPDMDIATARAFVEARRAGRSLAGYPGDPPADLARAYRIQDAALGEWERAVGGWKVGRINPPSDTLLGANRLSGPIFTDSIAEFDGTSPAMPVYVGGFAAAEAEFVLALAPPAHGALPQDDEATIGWIGDIRFGIEIASSPYPRINADGPCVTISDHGNNAGLVLGPSVPRQLWRDLPSIEIETVINGQQVGRATAATMLDGPLGAVRFLLANLVSRGIAPQAGWWVSSGAVTGVHEVTVGDAICARFGGMADVTCTIAAS